METKELREYLNHVLSLESALYQTNQLKTEYQKKRADMRPKEKTIFVPTKPQKPQKLSENISFRDSIKYLHPVSQKILPIFACISFFCIFFSISMGLVLGEWYSMNSSVLTIGILSAIPFICLCYKVSKIQSLQLQYAKTQNIDAIVNYEDDLEAYNNAYHAAQEQRSKEQLTYSLTLCVYNQETMATVNRLSETEKALRTSLYNLYSKNIVYTKYRNLIAIATLYEYIDSGRCFELEGPNGAYNLYEGELRSDIIISSLNRIISDLDTIKNNQYVLYKSIEKANSTTHKLLCNISNAQMLTAYYSEQAAIAASADRYIVGMIW